MIPLLELGQTLARIAFKCLTHAVLPFLLCRSIYRTSLHPLARIPGPRLAALSNLWYAYHVRRGRLLTLAKTLHQQYGPVVRVRPNEVWFDSQEAFKVIYNPVNGFDKSDFYLATALTKPTLTWSLKGPIPHFRNTLDLLSERDRKRYRLQRRLVGPTYQLSNLKRHEPAIDSVLASATSHLLSLNGATVDLKEWMHIITVECLGALVLSWSPGLLKQHSDGGSGGYSYLGWRKKSIFGLFPFFTILEWVYKPLGRLFGVFWRVTYPAPKGFKPFFTGVQKQVKRRLTPTQKPLPYTDLLEDLKALHDARPEFTADYLKRMAVTNFGAGHETLTSTLTSAFSMIYTHPSVLERVTSEILMAYEDSEEGEGDGPVRHDDCLGLRYTQASIKESQRLYPVIGMSLPRTVPEGGLSSHGYFFPPGTTVGCCPASLHRNPDIFGSEPYEYRPERWLDAEANPEAARAMERSNLIYGGGARICPGKNLAELLVCKIVVTLLKEFEIEVEVPPLEGMPVYFMSMFSGVKARFIPRVKSEDEGHVEKAAVEASIPMK